MTNCLMTCLQNCFVLLTLGILIYYFVMLVSIDLGIISSPSPAALYAAYMREAFNRTELTAQLHELTQPLNFTINQTKSDAFNMNNFSLINNQTSLLILMFTDGTVSVRYRPEPQLEACPYKCDFTRDRGLVRNASAVLFHMRDHQWTDIPQSRLPWQRYVLLNHESGIHEGQASPSPPRRKTFFNWTMTFRRDSDIYFPYGYTYISNHVSDQPIEFNDTLKNFVTSRPLLIAWAASNCDTYSKRELYIFELANHLPISFLGNCPPSGVKSSQTCAKYTNYECLKEMGKTYKFYLALENAACADYTSEKVFEKMNHYLVPIVLNRGYAEPLLPPKSFIALSDFASPKELADYLKYLDKNDTAYLEYFEWRNLGYRTCVSFDYMYRPQEEPLIFYRYCKAEENQEVIKNIGFCALCKKLHNRSEPSKAVWNPEIWWSRNHGCIPDFVKNFLKSN